MSESELETTDVGRGLASAAVMKQRWKLEIEQAIESVKRQGKRSDMDKWFRKQWYRARAIDRKRGATYIRQGLKGEQGI